MPIPMEEGTPSYTGTLRPAQDCLLSSTAESSILPVLPPRDLSLLSVPLSITPKGGLPCRPRLPPTTQSRSLTSQSLVTWTWTLLCIIYECVGRWNRNIYWGVRSHFPWKTLTWRVVMRVALMLSLISVKNHYISITRVDNFPSVPQKERVFRYQTPS